MIPPGDPENPSPWSKVTVVTPDGYRTIEPKPTAEQLKAYYRDSYYALGRENSQYAYTYTPEEIEHKYLAPKESEQFVQTTGTVFEVGCGEGFFLHYFATRGWAVRGVDFTDDGIKRFFPELRTRLEIGDVFDLLNREIASGQKYDLIACNKVLEHVLEPETLLLGLQKLLTSKGVCRICVPNDGSWLQHSAIERGHAEPDFYVVPPAHLSYFTAAPLQALLARLGFQILDLLADFPIDLFLLNPDTAYTKEKSKGRNCHFARIAFEIDLANRSLHDLIDFRRACARAGIGRGLIAYVANGS